VEKKKSVEKHIMLLFLSIVQTRDKKLSPAPYQGIGETHTTNESAVRYLASKDVALDRMFALVTESVRNQDDPAEDLPALPPNERTHLGYFKHRIKDVCPKIDSEEFLVDYPYEAKMPAGEMMLAVTGLAARIMDYVQEVRKAGGEVKLHVDTTGGMRHTNMMLLAVMRLLQYNDVQIGHILYSDYERGRAENYVEEINNVYGLFNVVAGAEEFVRFGSVSTLSDYFKEEAKDISPELSELLAAMRRFSEEIKLCHRGSFIAAASELKDTMQSFFQSSEEASNDTRRQWDALMTQIEPRLWADYRDLITTDDGNIDTVSLIRWCLMHDHLQQALTLYTESMPDYWQESGLITITPAGRDMAKASRKKEDKRPPEFWLLTAFDPTNDEGNENLTEEDKAKRKELASCEGSKKQRAAETVKKIFEDKKIEWSAAQEIIENLVKELEDQYMHIAEKDELCAWIEDLLSARAAGEYELDSDSKAVQKYKEIHAKIKPKSLPDVAKKIDLESSHVSVTALWNVFANLNRDQWKSKICRAERDPAFKLKFLCKEGFVETPMTGAEMDALIEHYQELRDERNHVNHARKDRGKFTSVDALKGCMNDALDDLDELVKKYKH